jgi:hypothetical protein
MQEQVSRQQYIGIDLHRRRSVIVRIDDTGKVRLFRPDRVLTRARNYVTCSGPLSR